MKKESKRQQQAAEVIRRNFSVVLQEIGSYVYGSEILVTVTHVKVTPDFGLAKIYLSIFNTENKQAVLLLMEKEKYRFKSGLAARIRNKVRRMPNIDFYIDETLDEMYRIQDLFNKLEEDNQMGKGDVE
ncbi:MAG TPA: 30S ribosome-binding factor RbfA [Phaeodactylibacter sp.]|nr:30S ribosome-binding factor RbfA [Phaeodactylibacter sp.]